MYSVSSHDLPMSPGVLNTLNRMSVAFRHEHLEMGCSVDNDVMTLLIGHGSWFNWWGGSQEMGWCQFRFTFVRLASAVQKAFNGFLWNEEHWDWSMSIGATDRFRLPFLRNTHTITTFFGAFVLFVFFGSLKAVKKRMNFEWFSFVNIETLWDLQNLLPRDRRLFKARFPFQSIGRSHGYMDGKPYFDQELLW